MSLTNSFRNKLLWSHYAESHKSVCLTVKIPQNLVYPICYSTERVCNDSDLDQMIDKSIKKSKRNISTSYSSLSNKKKIAYIKDKQWMYEKEYRIVFDETDEAGLIFEGDKWYMSVKITNVYLGVNFDKNEEKIKSEIIEACTRNGVKVSQMVLSEKNYALSSTSIK